MLIYQLAFQFFPIVTVMVQRYGVLMLKGLVVIILLFVMGTILAACSLASGQPQLIFYDSFEDPPEGAGMTNWSLWDDVTVPPGCCGPFMLDTGHEPAIPHTGAKSARATRA